MTSRGVVRIWNLRQMEGVIDSEDTPGGSLTLPSSVAVPGFPRLTEREEVEFEWQHLKEPEDGYSFLTMRVWPIGTEPYTTPATGVRFWNVDPDGTVTEDTEAIDWEPPRTGTPATGVVSSWNGDEGWGVIDSADTPGGCWTFFAALHPDEVIDATPGTSYKTSGGVSNLDVGEEVDFEWEAIPDQDGYQFRAIKVRVRREIPPWRLERTDL